MLRLNALVVDDEPGIRKSLRICLENLGHAVGEAARPRDAATLSAKQAFHLAFVDLRLGAENGMDLIPRLLESNPGIKIVVITAFATVETAVAAIKKGAFDYLPKPFTPAQVEVLVGKAAELLLLEGRIESLEQDLKQAGSVPDTATKSPAMRETVRLARQAAPTDATLLLLGENGTGKSLLARNIHGASRRKDRSFFTVSCPSLSPELLESELFGHARGAFTGAVRDYPGRIALSEGGTLFLDEIGDLPPSIQPKLLRFIQDREYERVGDAAVQKADVRLIAATNRNLEALVQEGKFREDLYYRLNVITIRMPSLKERKEDVAALAQGLLADFSRQYGKKINGFTEEALRALQAHAWPGNIRELRNAIERAVILEQGNKVRLETLPLAPAPVKAGRALQPGDPVSLAKIEEEHIRLVLASAPSLEEAAQILGINTATLWRRRKEYGL